MKRNLLKFSRAKKERRNVTSYNVTSFLIFIYHTVNKCYDEMNAKEIFHLKTSRLGSVMFEAIPSIP